MDYLSLCLIARDEDAYLREWVDYHILLGVERFYIYDNESRIPIRETLKEYVQAGWVTVTEIGGAGQQLYAYDHCLQAFGPDSRWIGFIDTDEFLVPKTGASLPEFLTEFEPYAGLAVSSLFFGTNEHRKKPVGGQIAGYTKRTPPAFRANRLVKSIMQPLKTLWPMSPHLFVCRGEDFIVNEAFQRVDGQIFPHHSQRIQLNHYFTRSREEVEEKLKRGRGDAGQSYQNSRFDVIDRAAVETDTLIFKVLNQVLPPPSESALASSTANNTVLLDALHEAAWRNQPPDGRAGARSVEQRRPEYAAYKEKVDRASALRDARDWDGVLKVKAELIEALPHCIVHITDFAAVCLQKGDYPLAWQAIGMAWKIAPQSQLVLQAMTEYYLRIQDDAWLEKISQMLIALNPQENTSYYPLAISLINQGQIDKGLDLALNVLPDLLDGSPNEQLRACLLIKTITPHLYARNEVAVINRLVNIAIMLNPQDVSLFTTLIQMNLDLKDTKTAEEIIARALRIHPENREILALKEIARRRHRQYNN